MAWRTAEMNAGMLDARWRLTYTASNGGASGPWRRASSLIRRTANDVLPVPRGPNRAMFVFALSRSATRSANSSRPTTCRGSERASVQVNGLRAGMAAA